MSYVSGLVIGTRKSGTTWLYENFLRDPSLQVSRKVKESGFFSDLSNLSANEYHLLYDKRRDGTPVEVDCSVCYSSTAPQKIMNYNPYMKIVLILRNPADYLASRYVHSFRKGEINDLCVIEALKNNDWLKEELDYPAIVKRFECFSENFQVFRYSNLERDPLNFYADVVAALGGLKTCDFVPSTEPINTARRSKIPAISKFLHASASLARKHGMHNTVNAIKSLSIHKKIETSSSELQLAELRHQATIAVQRQVPHAVQFYNALS